MMMRAISMAGEDDADAYMSVVELDYSVAMCC